MIIMQHEITIENVLIAMAKLRDGDDIVPCSFRKTLYDCIVVDDFCAQICYDVPGSDSTHTIAIFFKN